VGQDPSFRSLTQFSIAKSDGLTAVSEYLRQETHTHFDIPLDDIRVIPNFVDLKHYRRQGHPCHRSKFAAPGEFIVTHISNFRSVKRVEDVVRVFARISRKLPSRLLLVGDGPDRVRAHETADREGVLDRVLFLGKQNSVVELLACSDLFLLPSDTEAFGLVALEAMACGVPVVATRTGGIPEVVEDGASGYLAAVGDVEAMADAALSLLQDPDRWQRFSEAARRGAERFSADRVVAQYESYYSEVLCR
jgi:L-malate glycosyltransferase